MSDPWSCSPETVAFVAPGLVHRLGNAIFTVQGHAQLPDRPIPRDTVLAAANRGGRALAVARTLLGSTFEPPADPLELLEVLVDLTRIPFREAGHTLELTRGAAARTVDPGTFCPAIVEALRAFHEVLPRGQKGVLRIAVAADAGDLAVRIGYAAAAGELPFPLAIPELRQRLHQRLANRPRRPRLELAGAALELGFGGASAASAQA
ncbi:MAG: hypothetical protein KDE27_04910 [Planctomycetes bacterium]|nr:hypothetical protein [Planctomycetota bacterium]